MIDKHQLLEKAIRDYALRELSTKSRPFSKLLGSYETEIFKGLIKGPGFHNPAGPVSMNFFRTSTVNIKTDEGNVEFKMPLKEFKVMAQEIITKLQLEGFLIKNGENYCLNTSSQEIAAKAFHLQRQSDKGKKKSFEGFYIFLTLLFLLIAVFNNNGLFDGLFGNGWDNFDVSEVLSTSHNRDDLLEFNRVTIASANVLNDGYNMALENNNSDSVKLWGDSLNDFIQIPENYAVLNNDGWADKSLDNIAKNKKNPSIKGTTPQSTSGKQPTTTTTKSGAFNGITGTWKGTYNSKEVSKILDSTCISDTTALITIYFTQYKTQKTTVDGIEYSTESWAGMSDGDITFSNFKEVQRGEDCVATPGMSTGNTDFVGQIGSNGNLNIKFLTLPGGMYAYDKNVYDYSIYDIKDKEGKSTTDRSASGTISGNSIGDSMTVNFRSSSRVGYQETTTTGSFTVEKISN